MSETDISRPSIHDLLRDRQKSWQAAPMPPLGSLGRPVRPHLTVAPGGISRPARARPAGRLRVTGSHPVVGDRARSRYRVRQVQVVRRDTAALRDFQRGRDLLRPVTRAEFNRFRSRVRARLEWPPASPPVPVMEPSRRTVTGYDLAGHTSVVTGDRNLIRVRRDLMVRRCAVRLGRLVRRDDQFVRRLFTRGAARPGKAPSATQPWDAPPATQPGKAPPATQPWDPPPATQPYAARHRADTPDRDRAARRRQPPTSGTAA